MPQITRSQVSRLLRALLPQRVWTAGDLLDWLNDTQARNARATRSHLKQRRCRLHEQESAAWAA